MSAIWKIGLFDKSTDGKTAVCRECKEGGRQKYEFGLSNGSTKSLKGHLFCAIHENSVYTKHFMELEKKKNEPNKKQPTIESAIGATNLASSGKMNQLRKLA